MRYDPIKELNRDLRRRRDKDNLWIPILLVLFVFIGIPVLGILLAKRYETELDSMRSDQVLVVALILIGVSILGWWRLGKGKLWP